MAIKVKIVCGIFAIGSIFIIISYNVIHEESPSYKRDMNNMKEALDEPSDVRTPKMFPIHKPMKAGNVGSTNWIILITVNNGYFDFLQNWIHFYKKLHLNYPLIVIAEDDHVFVKLQQMNSGPMFKPNRSWRTTSNTSVVYGTKGFKELVSGRPSYILRYLEKGRNVVYTDVDTVWLHDPFPFFSGTFDIWMPIDGPASLCTGIMAINSNSETIELIRIWESNLKAHLDVNQPAFYKAYKKSNIRVKILDLNMFPSGELYFDKFSDAKRRNVIIVHNNFILGHDKKLRRFKEFNFWFS